MNPTAQVARGGGEFLGWSLLGSPGSNQNRGAPPFLRPQERGRTTVLIRPWTAQKRPPQELTPAPCNLRSRVHDYGGGALASAPPP